MSLTAASVTSVCVSVCDIYRLMLTYRQIFLFLAVKRELKAG